MRRRWNAGCVRATFFFFPPSGFKMSFGNKLESQNQAVYLPQATHEVVANRRSGQVGRARASSDIEKVVRA